MTNPQNKTRSVLVSDKYGNTLRICKNGKVTILPDEQNSIDTDIQTICRVFMNQKSGCYNGNAPFNQYAGCFSNAGIVGNGGTRQV